MRLLVVETSLSFDDLISFASKSPKSCEFSLSLDFPLRFSGTRYPVGIFSSTECKEFSKGPLLPGDMESDGYFCSRYGPVDKILIFFLFYGLQKY